MKILYHHRTLSRDGMDVHISELISALEHRGHEVIVIGPARSDGAHEDDDPGILGRIRTALPKPAAEAMELAYDIIAYRRLAKAWRRHRPDVLYERYNLFLLAGCRLKRRKGIPMILEVNSPLAEERSAHGGLTLSGLARWTERSVWQCADYVLPVTHVLGERIQSAGVDPDRIVVVPNGIDADRFNASVDGSQVRRELGIDDSIVLGFTGFMRPWHGLTKVIDAVARAGKDKRLHLLCVGDGPARGEIERHARERGVAEQLTITGVMPRRRIPAYTAAFDIALQPSVTPYASPLKLFEYMALAKAVVAPDQPNIREILTNGENALLIPPDDESALESAILRLASDPALRGRLGHSAANTISEVPYTWDANAAKIEILIDTVIPASPAR